MADVPAAVALQDVLITDELQHRPVQSANYLREKQALQDLARCMAEDTADLLPHLVALAMDLCEAESAGIGLLEPKPGTPGAFRWHHLRGALLPFDGRLSPRDFSPCGVCLDRHEPILMTHPERLYPGLADDGIAMPEMLVVPLHVGHDETIGTLWIVAREGRHFDSGHARGLVELAAFTALALRMVQIEQRLSLALEHQETLTQEMGHRVKNLFSITTGMIAMSARTTTTPAEMAEVLSGRLHALASAHAVVRESFSDGTLTPTGDLEALIRLILAPYDLIPDVTRFAVQGPAVPLGERAVNSFALVLHELATNAAKYEALKNSNGSVSVTWTIDADRIIILWQEDGGPPIEAPPTRQGFGGVLAQRSVVGQLYGSMSHDWRRAGLAIKMSIPLNVLGA